MAQWLLPFPHGLLLYRAVYGNRQNLILVLPSTSVVCDSLPRHALPCPCPVPTLPWLPVSCLCPCPCLAFLMLCSAPALLCSCLALPLPCPAPALTCACIAQLLPCPSHCCCSALSYPCPAPVCIFLPLPLLCLCFFAATSALPCLSLSLRFGAITIILNFGRISFR